MQLFTIFFSRPVEFGVSIAITVLMLIILLPDLSLFLPRSAGLIK